MRDDFETQKLKYARIWGEAMTFLSILHQIADLSRDDLAYSWYIIIIIWSLSIANLVCIFLSRKYDFKSEYCLILLIHVRLVVGYLIVYNILEMADPRRVFFFG